jgi:CO/xanthine dehydrogenase FAD-binding subunit
MQMNSAISEQDYLRPRSLAEALDSLAAGGRRILAGGTDIYPGAGAWLTGPVLDVMGLPELAGIATGQGLRIGATTTWTAIAEARLPPALHGLQAAARQIGGRQIQNAGTIGGNLCNASPAADGVPALLALEAEVGLLSASGQRRLPLSEFLVGPRQTAFRPGELLAEVIIPDVGLAGRSAFLKLGARSHLVISITMVSARIVVSQDRVTGAAIAVGACSPVAVRLRRVEAALIGARTDAAANRVAAQDVLAALAPIDDVRASSEYRREAVVELVRRVVAEAAG